MSNAAPIAIMMAAETARASAELPNSTPNEASTPPTRPNVAARPRASAIGPRGSRARALATTIGANGSTQGLKIVNMPAARASGRVSSKFTSPP